MITAIIAVVIAECLVPAAALLFHLAIMSGRRHTVARDEIRLVLVLFSRFVCSGHDGGKCSGGDYKCFQTHFLDA